MEYVTTVEEFISLYGIEVRTILNYLGVWDKMDQDDISQELYVGYTKMVTNYNPLKGTYANYVTGVLRHLKIAHQTSKGAHVSSLGSEGDNISYSDPEDGLNERLDSFKRFCTKNGHHGLGRVLEELSNRLGYTGPNVLGDGGIRKTYRTYRDAYLEAEKEEV